MNKHNLYQIGRVTQYNSDQALKIKETYKPALLNIDKFSHIIIF